MKAVVHIGDQKTGSKAIQHQLHAQRRVLAQAGISVLRCTKVGRYDMGLAAYGDEFPYRGEHAKKHDLNPNSDYVAQFEKLFADELNAHNSHTIVFSFEGLLHVTPDGMASIYNLLTHYFDDIHVVVFIRRQDRKAVSEYTTRLLQAKTDQRNILYTDNGNPLGTDYEKKLGAWRTAFARSTITVIDYDRVRDSWRSFAKALSIDHMVDLNCTPANQAVSAFGQELLRHFNATLAEYPRYQKTPHKIRQELRKHYVGEPLKPARADAELFYEYYKQSNRRLANSLGWETATLFDEQFSEYPTKFEPVQLSSADAQYYIDSLMGLSDVDKG